MLANDMWESGCLRFVTFYFLVDQSPAFGLACLVYTNGSPKIYASMRERERFPEVLTITGGFVLAVYALVMIIGYFVFANSVQIPGESDCMLSPSICRNGTFALRC